MKKGFTSVEVMIVILFGLLLLAGIMLMLNKKSIDPTIIEKEGEIQEKRPVLTLKREKGGYTDNFYIININGCEYVVVDAAGGYVSMPVHLANCTNCSTHRVMLEKGDK